MRFGGTWWIFLLLGMVLVCNLVVLFTFVERHKPAEEPVLASEHNALVADHAALQNLFKRVTAERDALLNGQTPLGSAPGEAQRGTEDLIREIKQHSGQLAEALQRKASQALLDHLTKLQNPPSCSPSEGRFMVCPMASTCGFGCAFHHLVYCFIAAVSDNRTMVISHDASDWVYAEGCEDEDRPSGWECYFQPISSCHASEVSDGANIAQWRRGSTDSVTTVEFWSRPSRGANFLPWASTDGDQTNDPFYIAKAAKDILGLVPHGELGDLRAWFVGQLEKYLIRPNAYTAKSLRTIHANLAPVPGSSVALTTEKVDPNDVDDWWRASWEYPIDQVPMREQDVGNWRHPIAGMHVRRTDHGGEAPFREVHEYLDQIQKWWSTHPENGKRQLRIYLATDEPKVIEEAGIKYPQFLFLTTQHGGRASGEGERSGSVHTESLLSDLFHLSACDFFVGTASSQVTRMAYELMQTRALDRHNWRSFTSLDAPWYFP